MPETMPAAVELSSSEVRAKRRTFSQRIWRGCWNVPSVFIIPFAQLIFVLSKVQWSMLIFEYLKDQIKPFQSRCPCGRAAWRSSVPCPWKFIFNLYFRNSKQKTTGSQWLPNEWNENLWIFFLNSRPISIQTTCTTMNTREIIVKRSYQQQNLHGQLVFIIRLYLSIFWKILKYIKWYISLLHGALDWALLADCVRVLIFFINYNFSFVFRGFFKHLWKSVNRNSKKNVSI